MAEDYGAYVALKKRRAKEQSKAWWFEAVLTDEEAHLRASRGRGGESSCNYCKHLLAPFSLATRGCSLGHGVTDCLSQICDEWKYFA